MKSHSFNNIQRALSHTPGIVATQVPDEPMVEAYYPSTLTIEGEVSSPRHDSEDTWAGKRVVREEVEYTIDVGDNASSKGGDLQEHDEPRPSNLLEQRREDLELSPRYQVGTPEESSAEIIVTLETDAYLVKLRAIEVEVASPFLILVHTEKPDFSPKGRCKFLAKIEGIQYSVDFIGIQFQIKRHGLYITTFLIDTNHPTTPED